MSSKTRQLLGWIGGQLHDAAFSASHGAADDARAALVIAVVLRKLASDVEGMIVKKSTDVTLPTFAETADLLREKH